MAKQVNSSLCKSDMRHVRTWFICRLQEDTEGLLRLFQHCNMMLQQLAEPLHSLALQQLSFS